MWGWGGFAWRGWRLLAWSVERGAKGWRGKARGGGEGRHRGHGRECGEALEGSRGEGGWGSCMGLKGRGGEDSRIGGPAVERGAPGAPRRHRLPRSLQGAGLRVTKGVHIWAGTCGALRFMWVKMGECSVGLALPTLGSVIVGSGLGSRPGSTAATRPPPTLTLSTVRGACSPCHTGSGGPSGLP